jgi:hypothetical protein
VGVTRGQLAHEAAKDHRERTHIEEFIRHHPPLAGTTLTRALRPDFILTRGTRRIGIEHTEIFRGADTQRGSALRASESLEDRVAQLACQTYAHAGHPPVHVTLHWYCHMPVKRNRVVALAHDIAAFVAEHVPQLDESLLVHYPHSLSALLPREVDTVHIGRLGNMRQNFWASARGTYVPDLAVGDVEGAIARKETKVLEYRASCDELWLLLVLDGFSPAAYLAISEAVRTHTFTTSADEVFLFEYFDRRVTHLRSVYAAGGDTGIGARGTG